MARAAWQSGGKDTGREIRCRQATKMPSTHRKYRGQVAKRAIAGIEGGRHMTHTPQIQHLSVVTPRVGLDYIPLTLSAHVSILQNHARRLAVFARSGDGREPTERLTSAYREDAGFGAAVFVRNR